LSTELSIIIDYKKNRSCPSGIFDAMSLYIQAYEDFGQVLTNALDIKGEFEFQLNEIAFSSIKAKLKLLPGKINEKFLETVYGSGSELFHCITETNETTCENDIEKMAAKIENNLAANDFDIDPLIDRRALSFALEKVSNANKLIQKDESVYFTQEMPIQKRTNLNTQWRLNCDPKKMFLGVKKSYEVSDKLFVKIPINEGNQLWTFKSATTHRTFPARITIKDWVKHYQDGLIQPIGPKDVIEATLSYDLYTPYNNSKTTEIRNAKILDIQRIIRNGNDVQYELTT